VFTARYALSPYIKQIRFVSKGLKVNLIISNLVQFNPEDESLFLQDVGNYLPCCLML
jgi:hypothetical protein